MQAIVRRPQPVIAEVGGRRDRRRLPARRELRPRGRLGGGALRTPGVHIGLFCSTPMVALSRNVAPKHAMEMLLTGETIARATRREFGLVNRVVAAGIPADRVHEARRTIASQVRR